MRDIPYSINYTGKDSATEGPAFKDIKIEKEGESHYITATYGSSRLRNRIGAIDAARLNAGEISLSDSDIAYKHFAYVLD